MYKIILADDHSIFRAGLKGLLDKDAQLKVVAEAQNGEELLAKLRSNKCDLIVLDLSMPEMDGISALKIVRQKYPKVKVLVLTMQKDVEHFKHAMKAGAGGYLLKDDAYEQLPLAIKVVLKGKQYISPAIAELTTDRFIRSLDDLEGPSLEILTKRELEILRCISNSLSNKNIAAKLKISIRTVETHRANLSNKLGIKNTAGLVKYAISKGLV